MLPNTPVPWALLPSMSMKSNVAGVLWRLSDSQSLLDLGKVCHELVARCRDLCLVLCLVVYCSAPHLSSVYSLHLITVKGLPIF